MKANVLVRADASVQVGSGHVMRCVTLAQELRERSLEVAFACRVLEGDLIAHIEAQGFPVLRRNAVASRPGGGPRANWCLDCEMTKDDLQQLGNVDWLIVDHYGLDSGWEKEVRPHTRHIMVIDDLANRRHDCDLLLDQNDATDSDRRYAGLLPEHCQVLAGPRYALLRPEFRDARRSLRDRDGTIRRILIFFSAGDPSQETVKALEALRMFDATTIHTDVVVRSSNPRREQIQALCGRLANAVFHCEVRNVAELMACADLAIGAAGTTTWERVALMLPAIVWAVADNQIAIAEAMARRGVLVNLGRASEVDAGRVATTLRDLLGDPVLVRGMAERARDLVDGYGAIRVADAMVGRPLSSSSPIRRVG